MMGDIMYFIDPRCSNGDYEKEKLGVACFPENSIITEENGFKNIITLPPGVSPNSYIEDQ
jgi:hypothetical protein